jgi:putative transposase
LQRKEKEIARLSSRAHVLVELAPTVLVSEVAKNLKGSSSHYIYKESGLLDPLYWQDGYGVVTLQYSEMTTVTRYINRQKEHNRSGIVDSIFEQIDWSSESQPGAGIG